MLPHSPFVSSFPRSARLLSLAAETVLGNNFLPLVWKRHLNTRCLVRRRTVGKESGALCTNKSFHHFVRRRGPLRCAALTIFIRPFRCLSGYWQTRRPLRSVPAHRSRADDTDVIVRLRFIRARKPNLKISILSELIMLLVILHNESMSTNC